VRAWFVLRVVLIGAESTGKTTLAQQLANHYGTNWVPEYGREHWEPKVAGLSILDPPKVWTREEFAHIALEQRRREELAARTAKRTLICDTNAFATGIWFERYHKSRNETVDQIGSKSKAGLYLLTAPDVPFVQDGFRDGEKIREWMDQRFLEQLQQTNKTRIRIEGPFSDRHLRAIEAIEKRLHLCGLANKQAPRE